MTLRRLPHSLLLLCLGLALASCAGSPPAPAPAPLAAPPVDAVAPNANLVLQGIPPIPRSIASAVARYTDFRGHRFVAWHPLQREMLVTHRPAGGSTLQLHRVSAPMATPEPLTDGPDPVRIASWEPLRGDYIVFERASGGSEADQVYRLDPDSRQTVLLTDPTERHDMQGWLKRSSRLLVLSSPLDRTAPGGTRAEVRQTLTLIDPVRPQNRRRVAEFTGTGWFVGAIAPDDKQIAMTRYISAGESQVWLLDIASGRMTQVLPAPGSSQRATYLAAEFRRDGSGLHVVTDRDGEFRELQVYDLRRKTLRSLTRHIPWDVSGGTLSEDGRLLALQTNVDGRDELRLFDARRGRELPQPAIPAGSVLTTEFHDKLPVLAFDLNNHQGPGQVYSYTAAGGRVEQWTQAQAAAGIDPSGFAEQRIVRWPSFDGRSISGLLTLPPSRFGGKRPVVVDLHGGPESQATFGFLGRDNYVVEELGVAMLRPNVRGSAGYGKTFLALDNGVLREDAVKDVGALLDWIATQPGLDATRVVVSGGSYGGYLSLAVAATYPERIAGAINVVGISNFVTFLRNTESYRRDLRRVEYGDERDPEMRAFLERISPLNNAEKIRKPLLVVHGRNDPRVPYTEAEQIVARVQQNGTPVWYLLANNEGHGFARKENADFAFYTEVLFLRSTLLSGQGP